MQLLVDGRWRRGLIEHSAFYPVGLSYINNEVIGGKERNFTGSVVRADVMARRILLPKENADALPRDFMVYAGKPEAKLTPLNARESAGYCNSISDQLLGRSGLERHPIRLQGHPFY